MHKLTFNPLRLQLHCDRPHCKVLNALHDHGLLAPTVGGQEEEAGCALEGQLAGGVQDASGKKVLEDELLIDILSCTRLEELLANL